LTKRKVAPKKVEVKQVRGKSQSVDTVAFVPEGLGARSGEQAGDLQGLSNVQGADSESVDELLEEGNAFEADAVKGVEDAGDSDEGEVRTHEVPQDDVPDEYRGKR
jgi:N utilization substance protein A